MFSGEAEAAEGDRALCGEAAKHRLGGRRGQLGAFREGEKALPEMNLLPEQKQRCRSREQMYRYQEGVSGRLALTYVCINYHM